MNTVRVGDVERSATNSLGEPIAQTEAALRAFWRWFGDSKVVDEQGRPLVVYHGTSARFEAFDNAKTGANDRGLWGRGHYFSALAEGPSSYALRQGDGARIIPVYLSVQHPLVLRTGKDLVTRLPDGTNTRLLIGENLDGAKIKAMATGRGHDGVIQILTNGLIGDIVVFSPTQIKSAIGNRGAFDPRDPVITNPRKNPAPLASAPDPKSAEAQAVRLFIDAGLRLGRRSHVGLVEHREGRVVGAVAFAVWPEAEPHEAHVMFDIVVDPMARGAGIGRDLVESAVAWWRSQRREMRRTFGKPAVLVVHAINPKVTRMLVNRGARVVMTTPDGTDILRMDR